MAVKGSGKVKFYSLEKSLWLTRKKPLKQFLQQMFKAENKVLDELTIVFCSDDYLLNINQNYLKHNTLTDIITFDLSKNSTGAIGEIYISLPRVRENSGTFNTSPAEELHRVIFHGVLHLCGYSDKTKNQKVLIRAKENLYLRRYEKTVAATLVPRGKSPLPRKQSDSRV